MDQPDNLIHQPVRLKIMAALKALPVAEQIEFVRLRKIVEATEGNLGAHIQTLEQADYVVVEKDFADNRPRTRIKLTKQGRRAFEDYVAYLQDLIAPGELTHMSLAVLHVVSASLALLLGLFVALGQKGNPPHRMAGLAYVFAMLLTNISALMLYNLTGRFNLFHAFALLSLFFILAGLLMPIARPRNWVFHHVHLMGWSYLGLLAAAANEAAIRLPLHLDTPPRILAVGAMIAVATGLAGFILRPQWERAALTLVPAGRR